MTKVNKNSALEARRNPLRSIRNLFRRPKVTANFPLDGKKIKMSPEKSQELAEKYKNITNLEEKAYQILIDLGLVTESKSPTRTLR
jgi:hypothetical protein